MLDTDPLCRPQIVRERNKKVRAVKRKKLKIEHVEE